MRRYSTRFPLEHWALAALGVFLVGDALASTAALTVRHRRLARLCRELPVLRRIDSRPLR